MEEVKNPSSFDKGALVGIWEPDVHQPLVEVMQLNEVTGYDPSAAPLPMLDQGLTVDFEQFCLRQ